MQRVGHEVLLIVETLPLRSPLFCSAKLHLSSGTSRLRTEQTFGAHLQAARAPDRTGYRMPLVIGDQHSIHLPVLRAQFAVQRCSHAVTCLLSLGPPFTSEGFRHHIQEQKYKEQYSVSIPPT